MPALPIPSDRRRQGVGPGFLLADTGRLDRPHLCIVVDTEEDFDWSGPFSRSNVRVSCMDWLPRCHAVFRRHGLRPTYLLDHPVACHPRAGEVFGPWLAAGECLVGAQLHPWVNPPFEEVVCPRNSYPCNLDLDLQERKLAVLTERIRTVLGVEPRVYKAGRYGLHPEIEPVLRRLGYVVDTSVLPFHDARGLGGGPDFFGYPDRPFWTQPDAAFLYLPVTQSLIGPLRRLGHAGISRGIFGALSSRLHFPGMLARLGLLERIMLTPEGSSIDDMRRLCRAMLRDGHRFFALSLHSSSLVPGGSPYVRSERDLELFIGRIEGFLDFFLGQAGGVTTDPIRFKALVGGASAPGRTLHGARAA